MLIEQPAEQPTGSARARSETGVATAELHPRESPRRMMTMQTLSLWPAPSRYAD